MNYIGHDLLSYCLATYDYEFCLSKMDRMDMWHLILMMGYETKTKRKTVGQKVIWILNHLGEYVGSFRFTMEMFEFMISNPVYRKWIPLLIQNVPILTESDLFWMLRKALYSKEEETFHLLQAIDQRQTIMSLLSQSRKDSIHISSISSLPTLCFLKQFLRPEDTHVSFIHFLYVMIHLMETKPIDSMEIRFSLTLCIPTGWMIWNYLCSERRIQEIVWLSDLTSLSDSLRIQLLEMASRFESSSDCFFQLWNRWKVPVQELNLFETPHQDICQHVMKSIQTEKEFSDIFMKVIDTTHVFWIQCLHEHFPIWFKQCWNHGREIYIMNMYDISVYQYINPLFPFSMSNELFWNLLHDCCPKITPANGNAYPRSHWIRELLTTHSDFLPSWEYLTYTENLYMLEYWSKDDMNLLHEYVPMSSAFISHLFPIYFETHRLEMIQWLYETNPKDFKEIPEPFWKKIVRDDQSPEALTWCIRVFQSIHNEHLFISWIDQAMIFACRFGSRNAINQLKDIFPHRYSTSFHKMMVKSKDGGAFRTLIPCFLLKINIFVSESFSNDLSPQDMECSICYGDASLELIRTNCRHFFCRSCLELWFEKKKQSSCPMCRTFIYQCKKIVTSS